MVVVRDHGCLEAFVSERTKQQFHLAVNLQVVRRSSANKLNNRGYIVPARVLAQVKGDPVDTRFERRVAELGRVSEASQAARSAISLMWGPNLAQCLCRKAIRSVSSFSVEPASVPIRSKRAARMVDDASTRVYSGGKTALWGKMNGG